MWRLADPVMLWWLTGLLATAVFLLRRRRYPATPYPPAAHWPPLPLSGRQYAAAAARCALMAAIALTIVSLARPQKALLNDVSRIESVAIQMAVDVSGSMAGLDLSLVEDVNGGEFRTRLDVVKQVFADFISRRPHDLIGLITFGGFAVTRVPLTFDHDLVRHVLDDLELPGAEGATHGYLFAPEDSMTAIGDALALACARLSDTNIASRIVVFLSDGESNFGITQPEEAVQIARGMGIKVYTIGIGREGLAPFWGHDTSGSPVARHAGIGLDANLLQQMADRTGGRYFQVGDYEGLAQAMAAIDQLEKTPVEQQVYQHRHEKMALALIPGLLLLISAVAVRCRLTGEAV